MYKILILLNLLVIVSCKNETKVENKMIGSWRLISGTLIEKGDTTITDFTKEISFIKILNESHFAFLQHDLNKGKDSSAIFVAGGGKYTMKGNIYKEHLEYCSAREWEGNDFIFEIEFKNDTMTQQGKEKLETEDIDRINIEKYVRFK